MISRFDGRGFVVGPDSAVEPHRGSIEHALFDPTSTSGTPRAVSNLDQILPALREQLIRALPFGPLEINEAKLIERYDVSRSVVRDMLSQLRSSGIVEKNERAKWVLPVLTAQDVRNHYQLRILLEPVALKESAPQISRKTIEDALARLLTVSQQDHPPAADTISHLEESLHVQLLAGCPNHHLRNTLQKSRLVLAINEMFRLVLGRVPASDRLLSEHQAIYQALHEGEINKAADRLRVHLTEACERTCKRLQTLSVLQPPELPDYLSQGKLSLSGAASAHQA